jgi:hypothetical protein
MGKDPMKTNMEQLISSSLLVDGTLLMIVKEIPPGEMDCPSASHSSKYGKVMNASKFGRALQNPSLWLAVFILAGFMMGLNVFKDFGVSFDEPGIYNFAPVVVDMYSTAFHPPEKPVFQRETFLHTSGIPTDLFNYGPFYFIAVELFVRGLHAVGIQTPYWDLWHLAYFVTFEACLVVFYLLCRRWLSGWASLAATILFATQPLILGHVFMNPKDTPFMIFFMAAVWAGLVMVDRLSFPSTILAHKTEGRFFSNSIKEWQTASQEAKASARHQLLVLVSLLILFLLAMPILTGLVETSITAVYTSPPGSIPGGLLRVFSSHPENTPLENFLTKSHAWLDRIALLIFLLLVGSGLWIIYCLLPESGRRLSRTLSSPFQSFFRSLFNPYVLLAGVLLGFAMSIRMFAPLAGALVLAYLFWKERGQAILTAAAYGVIAVLTSYLSWPYLWGEPVKRIIKSWQVMNQFSLPGSAWAFPKLLGIQYTEPAVLLAMAGFIIAIVELFRGKRSGLLFLFFGWSVLPIVVLMVKHASLYNNFRQVLFIIPPFFIIAGLAIDRIIKYFHRPWTTAALILIICLPGAWADWELHPYEYVYYNQFVGGVGNASRRYETDYWAVSVKEAAYYLNEAAPLNSTIIACAPPATLDLYLRNDLQVTACKAGEIPSNDYDYYVASGHGYINNLYYPQAKVVFSVDQDNAPLAVIKALKDNLQ